MAALLLAAPAAAQLPGTMILGGFGQYTMFDDALNVKDAFGYGGRVGAFISPNMFLEAEGSYTAPDWDGTGANRDVHYGPISARLMMAFPFMAGSGFNAGFQVGGGAVLHSLRIGNGYTYNYGAQGALGFTAAFGSYTALRLQALVDYMPTAEPDAVMNFRFQAGLDFWPDPASQWAGMSNQISDGPYVWWDDTPQPLPGTVEIGAFAQYSFMDDAAGVNGRNRPDDGLGYGGRVGVFLTPNWQIEGDGQWSPLDNKFTTPTTGTFRAFDEIDYSTFALRMNYNVPFAAFGSGSSSFLVGGGVVRTNYGIGEDAGRKATYNYGGSGIVGFRLGLAPRVAVRIDGVVDYMPNSEPEATLNYAVRGGLSLFLGGAARGIPAPPTPPCAYNSSILADNPACVPPVPPRVEAPPARCMWNSNILASDPNCREPVRVVAVDSSAITAPIYFDFDKSDIRPDAAATLDRKIPWFQANPGLRVRIEGNADNRGSDEYNLALGQRRAASARAYLVDRGIDAGRFDLVSYGEERPVCSETPMTEACHQLNRRDDFRIVSEGPIRAPEE